MLPRVSRWDLAGWLAGCITILLTSLLFRAGPLLPSSRLPSQGKMQEWNF